MIDAVRDHTGLVQVRQLARELGTAPSSIHYQLRNLVEDGQVVRVAGKYLWKRHLRLHSVLVTVYSAISNRSHYAAVRNALSSVPEWFRPPGG